MGNLNELEAIEGEIWANVWLTGCIARIDPQSGAVKCAAAGQFESHQGDGAVSRQRVLARTSKLSCNSFLQ